MLLLFSVMWYAFESSARGVGASAAAQVAALVAVVAGGLAAEAYGRQPPGSGSPTLTPKRSISSGTVPGRISSP